MIIKLLAISRDKTLKDRHTEHMYSLTRRVGFVQYPAFGEDLVTAFRTGYNLSRLMVTRLTLGGNAFG